MMLGIHYLHCVVAHSTANVNLQVPVAATRCLAKGFTHSQWTPFYGRMKILDASSNPPGMLAFGLLPYSVDSLVPNQP